jgi:hypothetical protein
MNWGREILEAGKPRRLDYDIQIEQVPEEKRKYHESKAIFLIFSLK